MFLTRGFNGFFLYEATNGIIGGCKEKQKHKSQLAGKTDSSDRPSDSGILQITDFN